jgi:hypothetical protein
MLRKRELLRKHVYNNVITIVVSYVQSAKRTSWKFHCQTSACMEHVSAVTDK